MSKNNNGYEYQVVTDSLGSYVEIYETDEQGNQGEMHLSIYVNTWAGETIPDAIEATKVELYDPMFVADAGEPEDVIARQRAAFEWFKEAYASVQDFKDSI